MHWSYPIVSLICKSCETYTWSGVDFFYFQPIGPIRSSYDSDFDNSELTPKMPRRSPSIALFRSFKAEDALGGSFKWISLSTFLVRLGDNDSTYYHYDAANNHDSTRNAPSVPLPCLMTGFPFECEKDLFWAQDKPPHLLLLVRTHTTLMTPTRIEERRDPSC